MLFLYKSMLFETKYPEDIKGATGKPLCVLRRGRASAKERFIIYRYVLRNAMLPQITQLALALGQVFSGVLIVEMVFSYPGIGLLLYRGVTRGDYNLVMGITVLSILTITTAVLILDLFYPLFDPRIRHK